MPGVSLSLFDHAIVFALHADLVETPGETARGEHHNPGSDDYRIGYFARDQRMTMPAPINRLFWWSFFALAKRVGK
jgi:hypothetical protein